MSQNLRPLANLSGETVRPAAGKKAVSAASQRAVYADDPSIFSHDSPLSNAVSRWPSNPLPFYKIFE
ncbi:MAG: hypothetical protein AAGU32_00695 [Bacillota bacterium]